MGISRGLLFLFAVLRIFKKNICKKIALFCVAFFTALVAFSAIPCCDTISSRNTWNTNTQREGFLAALPVINKAFWWANAPLSIRLNKKERKGCKVSHVLLSLDLSSSLTAPPNAGTNVPPGGPYAGGLLPPRSAIWPGPQ
jgi:hypothetical protein